MHAYSVRRPLPPTFRFVLLVLYLVTSCARRWVLRRCLPFFAHRKRPSKLQRPDEWFCVRCVSLRRSPWFSQGSADGEGCKSVSSRLYFCSRPHFRPDRGSGYLVLSSRAVWLHIAASRKWSRTGMPGVSLRAKVPVDTRENIQGGSVSEALKASAIVMS